MLPGYVLISDVAFNQSTLADARQLAHTERIVDLTQRQVSVSLETLTVGRYIRVLPESQHDHISVSEIQVYDAFIEPVGSYEGARPFQRARTHQKMPSLTTFADLLWPASGTWCSRIHLGKCCNEASLQRNALAHGTGVISDWVLRYRHAGQRNRPPYGLEGDDHTAADIRRFTKARHLVWARRSRLLGS